MKFNNAHGHRRFGVLASINSSEKERMIMLAFKIAGDANTLPCASKTM